VARVAAALAYASTLPSRGNLADWKQAAEAARRELAALLRDLVGNPFGGAVRVAPALLAWQDGCVTRLARSIYRARTFDRLPILADALEEAGCTEASLLGHLRGVGPHARGCFALDVLIREG
jgi:hypothetical protein